jgi:hypothetical protein
MKELDHKNGCHDINYVPGNFSEYWAEKIIDHFPSSMEAIKKLTSQEFHILSLMNSIKILKDSSGFYSEYNSSRINKSTLEIISMKLKLYQEEVDNYFKSQKKDK